MSTHAVTWLFVPGTRPERFEKAAASGAGAVILDLEDAVAAPLKDDARAAAARWLRSSGRAWVRVNSLHSACAQADLAALRDLPGLQGVVLPKTERAADTEHVARLLPVPVVALVESAAGLVHLPEVCASPATARVAFGSLDFVLDIGADHVPDALLFARSRLVVESRAAGLPSPIDGVTTALDDLTRVGEDAALARRLGFGGKLCVHPAQLAPIQRQFAPAEQEIAWATAVLQADRGGSGAARTPDGELVDEPVLQRARGILSRTEPR
ncbi:CoA ester lyase [Spirillospora sp. NPDC047418]|jgi:citrate lyase subunit beta/citryl-CoA lyase